MEKSESAYKVIIHPFITETISTHCEFLARVSEFAAQRLWDTLFVDITSLGKMPERCPVLERPWVKKGKYRWLLSSKRYRIIFQIIKDTVYIEGIQDCRQSDSPDDMIK